MSETPSQNETSASTPGAFDEVTESVREFWGKFRSQSIYYQLKAMVVVVYTATVVATLIFAPPAGRADNALSALVLYLPGDSVVGDAIVVENKSRSHWHDVRFSLDDFVLQRPFVKAKEKITLYVSDFEKRVMRKRRGRRIPKTIFAPRQSEASSLGIKTAEAEVRITLDHMTGSLDEF